MDLFTVWMLFIIFLYNNHSLLEPFEQILKCPQEANQHQTFTKASHLQGFLMLLRNPRRKRPSQLPLPSWYLLHQDTQEQQSLRLHIVTEKQHPLPNRYLPHQDTQEQQSLRLHIVTEKQHQSLKSSRFKTMEIK